MLFVSAAALLLTFFLVEWKSGEKASLPLRIFKNRSLLAGCFFNFCCTAALTVTEYYISIYFQGVRGYSAVKAGALSLPLMIGMSIATPLAGAFTSWNGYYYPTMYTSTVFASAAMGGLITIQYDSSLVLSLCMLGLLGFGVGFGIQAPQIAAQTVLDGAEVSLGFAVVQLGTLMGPVVFLPVSATLFVNRLVDEIRTHSPSTNITSLDGVGLTDLGNVLGTHVLDGVLTGYNEALVQTLILPLALACASIVGCVAMERKSFRKRE